MLTEAAIKLLQEILEPSAAYRLAKQAVLHCAFCWIPRS